jgi:hypothetical protein
MKFSFPSGTLALAFLGDRENHGTLEFWGSEKHTTLDLEVGF